jgi:hypothetical protein
MLLPIALVLGVLWGLGLLKGYTLGGAIHLLLVGAVVMAGFGLRQWWRRPMT